MPRLAAALLCGAPTATAPTCATSARQHPVEAEAACAVAWLMGEWLRL